MRDRAVVLRESPRVAIATPRLQGSIALKGARIDDLVLLDHRETIAKDSPPVRLLSPGGTADAYFAGFGWSGDTLALPGPETAWAADGATLAPGRPVTLRWDNGQGQRFALRFEVDANYLFTVTQTVATPARARSRSAPSASSVASASPRIRRAGRCTPARSAPSTARPIIR